MIDREMIYCEGCGDFHSAEECEVIVIRVTKGKNCPMPFSKQSTRDSQTFEEVVYGGKPRYDTSSSFRENDGSGLTARPKPSNNGGGGQMASSREPMPDGVGFAPLPEELPKNQRHQGIIPSAFRGMQIDPGNPEFEAKGDKETRRI